MEYKKCKLGSIANIIMGQSPNGSSYNNDGKGKAFLQGNRTFGRLYPTIDTWTTEPKKVARKDSILMSVRAPVGDLNIANDEICIGRGLCSIEMKNGNNKYLLYVLKNSINEIIRKSSGTVFDSINRTELEEIDIIDFNEDIQNKIINILSKIDEKIELNNQINDNLFNLAVAIYNNKFKYTNQGECNIGDYLLPKRGKNLLSRDAILGDIPVVAGGLEPATYHNTSNTKAPVITISASGANAGYVNLWNIPVWSSDSSYIDNDITDSVYFWYVTLKTRQKELFDAQTGSAQPHIYPQHIAELPMSKLEDEDILEYEKQVTSLFEMIGKNKKENKYLEQLKDTLLPKLMNGEIDLDKIEI